MIPEKLELITAKIDDSHDSGNQCETNAYQYLEASDQDPTDDRLRKYRRIHLVVCLGGQSIQHADYAFGLPKLIKELLGTKIRVVCHLWCTH